MEIDLKQFTMTIAVGMALALLVCCALLILSSSRPRNLIAAIHSIRPARLIAPAIIASVPLLALGLLIEDLSKRALETPETPHSSLAERFRGLMPSETFLRVSILLEAVVLGEEDAFRRCLEDHGPNAPDGVDQSFSVKATSLGKQIRETLGIQSRLSSTEQGHYALLQRIEIDQKAACSTLKDEVAMIYYSAKNRIYLHEKVHEETENIRDRYVFQRSLAFATLCGLHFLIVAYLVKSAIDLWQDVGKTETVIAAILILIAVISIADILFGWPRFESPPGARMILPAAFFWMCAFRLRRLGRRLKTFVLSATRTFGSERLIVTDRELCSANALAFVLVTFCMLSVMRMAYQEDQENYVKRVYGYFDTIRGVQGIEQGTHR